MATLQKNLTCQGTFDPETLKLNTMDYGLNVAVSPSNFQDQYNFVVSNALSGEAGLMEFNDGTNKGGTLTFYVVLNVQGTNPLYIQPFPADGASTVVVKLVEGGIGGKVLAETSAPIPPYVKPA